MTRFKYFKENWKLIIHLMFSTYRFGVNNKWWFQYDSIFGIPWYKKTPSRLIWNYKMARFRACQCYFVDIKTSRMLYPRYYKALNKRKENKMNKIQEWYSLARFNVDGFDYIGWKPSYGYIEPIEFDTIEEAEEYLFDMIEPNGVLIFKEPGKIVC